jgi:hypothetical protein
MIIIGNRSKKLSESSSKSSALINKFISEFIISPKELLNYFDNNLIIDDKSKGKTDRTIILQAPSSIQSVSDLKSMRLFNIYTKYNSKSNNYLRLESRDKRREADLQFSNPPGYNLTIHIKSTNNDQDNKLNEIIKMVDNSITLGKIIDLACKLSMNIDRYSDTSWEIRFDEDMWTYKSIVKALNSSNLSVSPRGFREEGDYYEGVDFTARIDSSSNSYGDDCKLLYIDQIKYDKSRVVNNILNKLK